jgi:hypothetical protein
MLSYKKLLNWWVAFFEEGVLMRKRYDDGGGGCCVTLESENLNGNNYVGNTGPAATGIGAGIALA